MRGTGSANKEGYKTAFYAERGLSLKMRKVEIKTFHPYGETFFIYWFKFAFKKRNRSVGR